MTDVEMDGPDWTPQKAILARDGFVVLRGVLPLSGIARARVSLARSCTAPSQLEHEKDPFAEINATQLIHLRRAAYSSSAIAGLLQSNAFVGAMSSLLGGRPFRHPRMFVRVNPPGGDDVARALASPPHQDHLYVQGSPDVLTAWIPLTQYLDGGGALSVFCGSHHRGLLPTVPTSGWALPRATVVPRELSVSTVRVNLGDVLIFHCLTVHMTESNAAAISRVSVDVRYQRPEGSISEASLLPPFEADGEEQARWFRSAVDSHALTSMTRVPFVEYDDFERSYFDRR